ncbi:DHH family phosphoesterase [uncultured Clostridium sp.]|uniref:DHH family phosphoesterase n=1 Tax=uncultured Clostridium sp. TaxID=59620 RepID=UPI0026F393BB|nr:DHH family phosphoesterase [uncultured Clostridium sp.]
MDFYERVFELGLSSLLDRVEYKRPNLINEDKVLKVLEHCIKLNAKTLIYGDYDLDGLMSLMIVKDTFKYLGHTNYYMFRYMNRTHSLDRMAVAQAISGRFKYMIICDTASSDLYSIKRLLSAGITPIIIDHHVTDLNYDDYPEGCYIINSITNGRLGGTKLKTSAGALSFIIMDNLIKHLGKEPYELLSAYATVSLYSDCMDMSDSYNRGIYYRASDLYRHELPDHIIHFMNEYVSFNRRFIEFHFAPKINAIFRSENFRLINNYFLAENLDMHKIETILKQIDVLHSESKELVTIAADIIEYRNLDNFIIGNLSSVDSDINIKENKLYNYTGLVANILAGRFGKTAVVYCNTDTGTLKGSVRDIQSRDYLSVFKQFCKAGGHNSAFGINMSYFEFENFIDSIERIDKRFSLESIPNEPIIIKHERVTPDPRLITDMASYNEFSGSSTPVAFIKHRLLPGIKEYRNQYSYKYKWGDYYIQSNNRLRKYSEFIAKPTNSSDIKLMV